MEDIRFVGIDPSLKSTGVVILDEKGKVVEQFALPIGTEEEPQKYMRIAKQIRKHLDPSTDKVLIEAFSFGSKGAGVSKMYGIGWTIRIMLVEQGFKWGEVAPTALKKFASGKGQAKKEDMILPVYKKWGFESTVNDITDAFVLSRVAFSMYNHDGLLAYEKEVLKKLKKI